MLKELKQLIIIKIVWKVAYIIDNCIIINNYIQNIHAKNELKRLIFLMNGSYYDFHQLKSLMVHVSTKADIIIGIL